MPSLNLAVVSTDQSGRHVDLLSKPVAAWMWAVKIGEKIFAHKSCENLILEKNGRGENHHPSSLAKKNKSSFKCRHVQTWIFLQGMGSRERSLVKYYSCKICANDWSLFILPVPSRCNYGYSNSNDTEAKPGQIFRTVLGLAFISKKDGCRN